MCGRAREHRNRDRFGFYDDVERCARTGNDAIYTFAERSVFESAHVVEALRSLGVANRCTRTFYCIASLYFITSSLSLPPTPYRPLWPILNLLRLNADSTRCIIRPFIMLRFHYAACAPAVCTRVCVRTQRNTRHRVGRFLIWNLLYSRRERSIESPWGARPLFGHFHCVAAYITTRPLFPAPAFSTRDILYDPLYTRDTWRFRLFHAAHARI